MKKFVCLLIAITLVGVLIIFGTPTSTTQQTNDEYLRIHIRANSNSFVDQNAKLAVRDKVVDFMIPILAECQTKPESMTAVNKNLSAIESVADSVLKENGFFYGVKASLRQENFPTRTYGDLTLESGFYDALILELGTGTGDNWWCVVYPPLCFVNGGSVVNSFKSRILDIINSFA